MTTDDPRRWMWNEALDLLAQADRLHRELFRPSMPRPQSPRWEPPVDVLETDREVVVVAALPGVADDGVTLAIENASLVIEGERIVPEGLRNAAVHRLELPQGRFLRRVPLPAGRYDQLRHYAKDGCHVVSLRKLT